MPHPTTFFIRPKEGLRIADPKTGEYLPESGMLMPRSGFWLRRLKDGDVVAVEQTVARSAQDARPALSRAEGDGCEPGFTPGEATSPTASCNKYSKGASDVNHGIGHKDNCGAAVSQDVRPERHTSTSCSAR